MTFANLIAFFSRSPKTGGKCHRRRRTGRLYCANIKKSTKKTKKSDTFVPLSHLQSIGLILALVQPIYPTAVPLRTEN